MGRLASLCSFLLFASLVLAGCGGVSQTAPEGKSSNPIKVAIKLPSGISMLSGGRVKSTNPRIAATTITSITLDVTGEGMESVSANVPIPSAGATVAEVVVDVPFGLARLFQVTILTSTDSIFRGSTTLDIDASKAVLNTATSELEIPVTIDVNIDIDEPSTTVTPSEGTYNTAQTVTVTCADVSSSNQTGCAKMFLTTDGTTPLSTDSPVRSTTAVGAQLTHTVNIPAGVMANVTTVLKFFSIDMENNVEDVKTATYTIDTLPPVVSAVTTTASAGPHKAGVSIPITVTMSEPVNVGTPVLTLDTGASGVTYNATLSNPGSGVLLFDYVVQAGQNSGDLVPVALADGGGMTDLAGNTADFTVISASLAVGGIAVDTAAPAAPNIDTPGTPTTNNIPTITGTAEPSSIVTLNSSISGTISPTATANAITGVWTVTPGTPLADGTHLLTATSTDSAGNVSSASTPAATITIDTTAPSITDVTSTTADGIYAAGSTIAITVTFSEPVNVAGSPILTLATGVAGRSAVSAPVSNSTTLTFSYTVQAGDDSPDLDYSSASALTLSGGSITDLIGTPASLTLPTPGAVGSLSANKALVIDAVAPTVPGTPTDAGAFSNSTTVTFNWAASTDSNSGISHYLLSVGTTPGGTDILNASNVGNVLTATATAPVFGGFGTAVNFAVGSAPLSVAVGDFNGDGNSDLAVANQNNNNVSVLLGDGLGSFGTAVNFAVGSAPLSVAAGDFNGAGKSDLAVANFFSNNVSILLGDGLGGFGTAVNITVGLTPRSVAISDFNGDGKPDLAVANLGSNNVSILLGDGAGSFGTAMNFAVGTQPFSVAIGDFDGDGKSDLAVANRSSGNVSILLGDGAGSFGVAVNIVAGAGPIFVAIGDFNGDGKSDLAVANDGSNDVSILIGNGAGGFVVPAVNFAVGSFPRSVAIGDFNGDGKSDLAAADAGSNNVSVLLGDGAGSFGTAVNFAAGNGPTSVAISDFDGDGALDLAVANRNSNNVSVLLGIGGADGQTLYASVTAVDVAGNSSGASNNSDGITIDTTPPVAPTIDAVTSPTNGQTPTITGTAEAGTTVELFDGTTSLGTAIATTGGTWSITLTTPLTEGTHTLTVTSTDAATNSTGTASATTLVIDISPPPTPTVTSPTAGATITATDTPTVSGTAEAGATVTIFDGSTLVGTATADGTGAWSIATSALADGTHTLTVTATDASGNVSATPATVTIAVAVPPTVVSSSPASGAIDAATDGSISVTFSEAMDTTSITTTSFTVSGSGGAVTGTISFSAGDTVATFTPSANLAIDTVHTVNLTGGITDVAGNALAATSFSFTTTSIPRFAYVANSGSATVSMYTVDAGTGQLRHNGYVATGVGPISVVVDKTGRFAYVTNFTSNDISVYTINQTTGKLISVGPAVAAGTDPFLVTIDPSARFAYVANNGSSDVSAYTINKTTGELTSVGAAVATGSFPQSVTVDPSGRFVYVTNDGGGGVSAYTINQTTGALTAVAGAPFTAGATPRSVAVDPSGRFAYVANLFSDNLSTYTINQTTGALTSTGTVATGTNPISIAIDPSGRFAYVANATSNDVYVFTINQSTGVLTPVTGAGGVVATGTNPFSVAVDPSGKFAYTVNKTSNDLSVYTIDQNTGALTAASTINTQSTPITIAITGGNAAVTYFPKFAYVANQSSNDVSAYTIDPATGALTELATSPFTTGAASSPQSVAVDSFGNFAYAANWFTGTASAYTVDSTTGELTELAASPFTAGTNPRSVTVDPSGRFAYVANEGSNNVSAYTINTTTGALTSVGTVTAGAGPSGITVDPSGRFVYVANRGTNDVSAYTIDLTTGALTSVGATVATGSAPFTVTVDPSGKFVYVANISSGTVSAFTINQTTGALTAVGTAVGAGTSPHSVTVDPLSRFVYVGNNAPSGTISAYTINKTTGALTELTSSPFTAGTNPRSVTVDPSGKFAYVANRASNDVLIYTINQTTGALTSTGTVVAAGTGAVSVFVTSTFDIQPPAAPTINSPTAGATVTTPAPTISGTTEPNASVTVFDGSTAIGSTTADSSGNWSLVISALPSGSHTITITATDSSGNVGPASGGVTFTIDTSAALRILGTWGFAILDHFNIGGWGVEGGTVTLNSDGTGFESFTMKESTGAVTTVTNTFAWTATNNQDGSITVVQTNPDTTTDATTFVISDDGSMMIEDSTVETDLQGLSVAVRMDRLGNFSNADFTGDAYSIGYERDGNFNLYRARSSINTADGAGGITFSDFANENGTFMSGPGSTTYSINGDGTFTAGAAMPKPITGHIGGNGLVWVDTTANPLGTSTPPWWSMDFNMIKGDKVYTTADLAGTWAFVGFGDDGGTTFSSDFGTLVCDTAGSCTVSGRENMNGSFNAFIKDTTNGPFTVAADGSFGTSLHSGGSTSPSFAAAIGNGGNTIIINESFDDSVTANKTNRFMVVAVKCTACTGLGENIGFPIAVTSNPEGGVDAAFDGTNWLVGVQGSNLFAPFAPGNIAGQMIDSSGNLVGGLIQMSRTGGAPHVAFDGTNYLMVWPDDVAPAPGTDDLFAQFVSPAGALVGSAFPVATGSQLSGSGNEEFGGLAFGGGKYLAVYYKEINSTTKDSKVFGRIIDSTNPLLPVVGPEIPISSGFGDFGIHSVAFNGTDFLVVWAEDGMDKDVMGRFVSTAGVPLGMSEFVISTNSLKNDNPLSVACDPIGGLCAVAWTEEYDAVNGRWDTFVRIVAPSGPVGLDPGTSSASGGKFLPFVAWDGSKFLLTWSDATNDLNSNMVCDSGEETCWDLYGQYIDATGAKVGNPFVISDDPGNQLGIPVFGGGQSLVLINNGTGISQTAPADDLFGLFIPSANVSGFTQPSIAAGTDHTLALKDDGSVWEWGRIMLSPASFSNSSNPVQKSGLSGIVEIADGTDFNLVLKSNGTVMAWGVNSVGQLGDGATADSATPVRVGSALTSGLAGIIDISAGSNFGLALRGDGSVWAWGNNGAGKLGDGTASGRLSPVEVCATGDTAPCSVFLSNVVAVSAGAEHSLALKSDGTVWAWGSNTWGQLGDNSIINRQTPVQVIGLTGVTDISAGAIHSLALLSDGTVWAWGAESAGRLGNGSSGSGGTLQNTPVQVTGLTTAIAVSAGGSHSLALLSDGTVMAWGENVNGALGDGTVLGRLTPVPVTGLAGVTDIAASLVRHSVALLTDGTINTWGFNTSLQLGNGTSPDSKSPVQVIDSSSIPFNVGVQATKITSAVSGAESITVNWSANPPAGSYNLYWDTSPGVNTANGTKVSGITGTTFAHTGLSAENDYYYVVTVVSGTAESPISNEIRAGPLTAAPTGVAGDPENKQNRIAWNALTGADSFKIYWNTTGSVTTADSSFTSSVSYALHSGLANGTTYYYRVAGVNPSGAGALSAEITITPATVGAVLGQSDGNGVALSNALLDAGGPNDTSAYGLSNPHELAIDPVNLRLFAADSGNDRVLVYQLDANFDIVSRGAINVIGQPDTEHEDTDQGRSLPTAASLDNPRGVDYYDDGTNQWLLVADTTNHRLLIYDITGGITDGMAASRVLGQADFTSESINRTGALNSAFQNSLQEPERVIVAEVGTTTLVIVADRNNDRVMIWDITTGGIAGLWNGTTGKQNADYVIGQYLTPAGTNCAPDINGVTLATSGCTPDFTTAGSRNSGRGTGDGSLNDPTGLVMWGNKLVVADHFGDRVMVFDLGVNAANLSTTHTVFADFELGQFDFTGQASSSASGRFDKPESMAVQGNLLFVADEVNDRVYVFDLSGTPTNGMSPVFVYGQTSLGGFSGNAAQNGLNGPEGMAIAGQRLYVSEVSNDRIISFDITTISADIAASAFGPNGLDLIGQTDHRPGMADGAEVIFWDTDGSNDTGAVGMDNPNDVATGTIKGVNYIFVTDFWNDRVLVFEADRFFNPKDLQADFVIGEPDFDHDSGGVTQDRLNSPYGVAFDDSPSGATSKYLFVSDRDKNRVMVFDLSSGITNGMNATAVLGQTGFTSSLINGTGSTTPALNGLYSPRRLNIATVSGTKYLFVAERKNARVSIFNISDGVTTGENASFFLGNADGVTKSTAISKSIMITPYSTEYDPVGQRLFVVDRSANRVLVYDLSTGITTGMSAVNVIGQPDFISSTLGTSASTFHLPQDVAYDSVNNQLFVNDLSNNRALVFDLSGGVTDGMSAISVIGQSDFTTSTSHLGTSRTSLTMHNPSGIWYEPHYGRVFITQEGDERTLVLNPASGQFTASPIPNFASSVTAAKEISLSWGSVTGAVSYNVYRGTAPGVSIANGTLVISGSLATTFTDTALTPGTTYYYVVTVVDSSGVESPISAQVKALAQGTSGELDLSFATVGHATLDITGFKDKGRAVAIDSQGRIVVGGTSGTPGIRDFALARYLPDGTLDTTFGASGTVTTDISGVGSDDHIRDIKIDSTGRIVAVGWTDTGGARDMAIVRYNSNGSLDTLFGTNGIVKVDSFDTDDIARAVEIDSTGKILVAGQFGGMSTSDFAVVRLNSNGSLDTTSFNPAGIIPGTATHDFGGTIDKARGLAIDSAGRILVSGDFESSPGSGSLEFGLIRLLSDGSPDTNFGFSGENSAFIGNGAASGGLAIDSSGNILLAGEKASAIDPALQDFILVRFDSTGQPDSTFGTNGEVVTDINGATDWVEKVLIDANQNIIVLGYVTPDDIGINGDFAVARYNGDGTLDTNFAGSGKVTSHFGMNQVIFGGTIDADNRIVVAGASGAGTSRFFEVARYWNNGFPYTGPSAIFRFTQPSLAGGGSHTLALKDDGTVWAWGLNDFGQLGNGAVADSLSAVQVSNLSGIVEVSADTTHSIALKSNGTVWAWGDNVHGQLGDGTVIQRVTTVQVCASGQTAPCTAFLNNMIDLAAGGNASFALRGDGTVWAWGKNFSGELGNGTTTSSSTPVQVTDPADASGFLQGVIAVAASRALKSDGTVWAWGLNNNGQLGDGTTTQRLTPVQVTDPADASGFLQGVTAIAAGGDHSLALKSDGTVWTWGSNFTGQLGNGTVVNSSTPVQVTGLTGVLDISAGTSHNLALLSDGSVWAWGNDSDGQLGTAALESCDTFLLCSATPVQLTALTGVTDIVAGGIHSIALLTDGTISSWGDNGSGQFSNGTRVSGSTPVQAIDASSVPVDLSRISATAVAGEITLDWNAVTGAVSYNIYRGIARGVSKANGTLIGSSSSATTFTDIFITPGIKYHYVVTAVDSSGVEGPISSPVGALAATTSAFTKTAVAAGGSHTLALKDDGTVWAWGANWYGQLGTGSTTDSSRPVQVSGLTGVTAIAGGAWHSLALKSDGTLWAWGANWNGQLGDGTFNNSSIPLQITGLPTGVTAISAGSGHSLALLSDGTLWAWGRNFSGQLGNGTTTSSSTPVQVSSLTGVRAIAAGHDHSLALLSDGTVRAWGFNGNGELGDGTTTSSSTPVQVSNLAGVAAIAVGDSHNLALLSDGTLWAWGANWYGQLGNGATSMTATSTPVQVSGLAGVVAVSAGDGHSVALKSDGTIWAWGANWNGQLGDGTFSNSSTPVQATGFPTDTSVSAISSGGSHNIVIKSDGTILSWGGNFHGQLGDGTTNENTMPVPVIDSASVPFNLGANILTVDTGIPSSPSVVINSGAAFTASGVVTLGLSATDDIGVVGYFVSESSVTPAVSRFTRAPSAVSFSATAPFPLSAGDGFKTVNAWFIDVTGKISGMASASITLGIASATTADCLAAVNSIQGIEKVDESLLPGIFVAAKNTCTAAATALSGVVSNDADTARFFAALGRVAATGFDLTSDSNRTNGLNTTGEVLEAFGCDSPGFMHGDFSCSVLGTWKDWTGGTLVLAANGTYTFTPGPTSGSYTILGDVITFDGTNSYRFTATRSQLLLFDVNTGSLNMGHARVIPSTAPTGAELQTILAGLFKTELDNAVADLTAVSSSFNVVWWTGSGGTGIESDYGDVLTVRGFAKAMLGWIGIENSYDLNLDIGALSNAAPPPTTQQLLSGNPNFLTLSTTATADLLSVQTYASGASADLTAAINAILAETDAQSDDFINLVNSTTADINGMLTDLANITGGLTSPTVFNDQQLMIQKGILDLTNFFAATVDLRSLLPTFVGDTPGLFPDSTFNGVWDFFTLGSAYDANRDVVGPFLLPGSDGIPDILQ